MADGGLTVQIDDDLAADVKAAAEAMGVSVDFYVRKTLACRGRDWSNDPDPAIDEAIADEAAHTGDLVPAEDVVAWMRSWFTDREQPMPLPPSRR